MKYYLYLDVTSRKTQEHWTKLYEFLFTTELPTKDVGREECGQSFRTVICVCPRACAACAWVAIHSQLGVLTAGLRPITICNFGSRALHDRRAH